MKGKDPSNFWLKTEDNGKGKILNYLSPLILYTINKSNVPIRGMRQ